MAHTVLVILKILVIILKLWKLIVLRSYKNIYLSFLWLQFLLYDLKVSHKHLQNFT